MLLDPQFVAEQILNSLQFSMLLFLLAIGLSVVFGLMDYLNLSHGTIYMFAAYVAFSLTHIGGSFWIALLLAPLVAAAVGVLLYFVLLKRAEKGGHLTQVLLTVGVIYMGTDLIRIVYGDLPKNVPQPEALNGAINLFGIPYPSYRLFIIGLGLAIMVVLYFVLERTRLGALVRAGVDDRATAETLGIDIAKVFALVFGIGTYLAGIAGVVAAPVVPGRGEYGAGPPVDRSADVPAARAGAVHDHPVVEPRGSEPVLEDDVRHRGAADVAEADQCDGVSTRLPRWWEHPQSRSFTRDAVPQFTSVITIDPHSAFQKPSTWKPMPTPPAIHAVSISIRALMTSRNSPSVKTMNGIEKNVTTGRTKLLTNPRISATSSSGSSLCRISSWPAVGPVK